LAESTSLGWLFALLVVVVGVLHLKVGIFLSGRMKMTTRLAHRLNRGGGENNKI
jgi:uncharacterized sodium:solute symporter family permease YidK